MRLDIENPQNTIESYMKTGIFGETVEEIQSNFFRFTMIIGYILLTANTIQLIYYIVSDFL